MTQSFDSASDIYLNIEDFIDVLADKKTMVLRAELETIMHDSAPCLRIETNDLVIFDGQLKQGINDIELEINLCHGANYISMGMRGKQAHDTLVDANGTIIGDKAIKINKLFLDGFNLLDDFDFFDSYTWYYNFDTSTMEAPKVGFWNNADLTCAFFGAWTTWYNDRSNKNSTVSSSLTFRKFNKVDQLMEDIFVSLQKLKA